MVISKREFLAQILSIYNIATPESALLNGSHIWVPGGLTYIMGPTTVLSYTTKWAPYGPAQIEVLRFNPDLTLFDKTP